MSAPLSSTQFKQLPMFLTPHEVADMHGSDFDAAIKHTKAHMEESYAGSVMDAKWAAKQYDGSIDPVGYSDALRDSLHSGEFDHGGPTGYIEHLKASGPIHTPVSASISVTRQVGGKAYTTPDTITDGHHRAVAAMETGRLLPVRWNDPRGPR